MSRAQRVAAALNGLQHFCAEDQVGLEEVALDHFMHEDSLSICGDESDTDHDDLDSDEERTTEALNFSAGQIK